MASMTLFVQEAAMTTTLLTHEICREVRVSTPAVQHSQPRPLRMSWIVVTDEQGRRTLRGCWAVEELIENDSNGKRTIRSEA